MNLYSITASGPRPEVGVARAMAQTRPGGRVERSQRDEVATDEAVGHVG